MNPTLTFTRPDGFSPGCTEATSAYLLPVYSLCIPDNIKVNWYRPESQSEKISDTVTVVVQCDGSQVDSC